MGTGRQKNAGCFNYVQQFCQAVETVGPKFFKIRNQPTKKVTLSVTKPRTHAVNGNKAPKAKCAKAGKDVQEADANRNNNKSLELAVAPETFYDVVMRAALDKDFRDFNQQGIECRVQSKHLHDKVKKHGSSAASFRLKLHPSTSIFTPNVNYVE